MRNTNIQKVLKFYQRKFPKNNYTFDSKSIKKELSERSQKLVDLPQKGETPQKDLRKVCYKRKGEAKVFRDRLDKVKPLVDSGDYEFAPKQEWKSQILDENKKVVKAGTAYKSNITPSPNKRKLGERKQLREARDMERQLKIIKGAEKRRLRQQKRKPGDAERALQSKKDKEKVAEERKSSNKKYKPQRLYRAYEAVILGENSQVLGTISVKAKSNDHAERLLKIIMKNKGKSAKLTGNIREWVKQTGKNRPKNKVLGKKPGTNKPRRDNPT